MKVYFKTKNGNIFELDIVLEETMNDNVSKIRDNVKLRSYKQVYLNLLNFNRQVHLHSDFVRRFAKRNWYRVTDRRT